MGLLLLLALLFSVNVITTVYQLFFATFAAFYQSYITHSAVSPVVPASKSYTVAIIKPDAVAHGKANEIIMKVHRD